MDKPAWAKRHDIMNWSIVGIIMLFVLWDAVRTWLGY